MNKEAGLAGSDLYLERETAAGSKYVTHHRVWDRARFYAEQASYAEQMHETVRIVPAPSRTPRR